MLKNIVRCFFILFSIDSFSQSDFYCVDSIREIRIYFYDTHWDNELDSLYIEGNNERILADLIIDGVEYDSVGVRYKGFSSVSVNRLKNPFNIKLDYVISGQDHQGIDKLKLANVYQDPSFIREVLTYEIASNYMPSAKANYANIFINDTFNSIFLHINIIILL